ncbi:MAG: hypothetical protein ACKOW8_12490 [Flavobacteriales bacterium]
MKTEFVPPMNGQVIGTHKATALVFFMSRSRVYIAIGLLLLSIVSILLGEELSRKDFFPIIMIFAILIPSFIRMRINHHGKQVSIILTNVGVAIADSKIELPFASHTSESKYGIDRFRLEGDSIVIDTTKAKGQRVFINSMEINSVKFMVLSEYSEHKDELLNHLNSLASKV